MDKPGLRLRQRGDTMTNKEPERVAIEDEARELRHLRFGKVNERQHDSASERPADSSAAEWCAWIDRRIGAALATYHEAAERQIGEAMHMLAQRERTRVIAQV